ncbi:BTAD domain-containing putative transcriptional regulator [Mesorhizobium sp. LHD-90]|uniref:BTAD domain-containing putative transcriptional regulator n=1 Tax=Mesorhizobium sp. LHD-90 TaxID=3071414 RepID=UPI0027E0ECBA|nr:BTAD domain-containing putative transcriptional regulator [Mesorhizobium sp. LHD-90]MDQ6434251.1 BTAD domain-containing putative transcriptional regulator [Mesorhizobium sp. LHD-90]
MVEKLGEESVSEKCLEVRLLGSFEMRCAGKVQAFDKRKACAILAYLLLSEQTRETRGRLSALLWSDRDEEHARASLRQSIRDLRQIEIDTGLDFLLVDKLSVGVDRSVIKADVSEVQRALAERDFAAADRLLSRRGELFCGGVEDCDPVFDNWLRTTSTHWCDGQVQSLSKVLDGPNSTLAERKAIATCILRLDPFHEAAAIEMLRALHREGGYARARVFFERYAADLRSELDISPSRDIVRQLEQFRSARETPDAGAASSTYDNAESFPNFIERPTIVLVTERYKATDAHVQFALVSELSASLSRFRHWTAIQAELDRDVLRSGSIEALRAAAGGNADLAVVITASDDGHGHAFEISCRALASGDLQFATTAPAEPSAWRTVFNEICAQVASRLQLVISTTRLHRIAEQSPNYISAYDSWLDGQRLSILWRNDTEAAAIARYEDAIRLDPRLSCAYSSLAAILNSRWIVLPGYPLDSADLDRAFDLAKQAVMLDPLDHRNQVNLAWSHLLARRWELADFHFRLAHDLNAANPSTLIAYSLASGFIGNHERAVELARRSFELNPLHEPHYYGYLATVCFLAGDLQGCLDAVEKSDGLFPDIRGWSAAANALLGNDATAGADFRMFLRSVTAAWHNGERPTRRAAIDWFRNVFPIRLDADRERLWQGIDRAARLA